MTRLHRGFEWVAGGRVGVAGCPAAERRANCCQSLPPCTASRQDPARRGSVHEITLFPPASTPSRRVPPLVVARCFAALRGLGKQIC